MTSRLFFVLFVALALVACTNESDSLTESVENQNAINISRLKSMASDAGWSVTPNVLNGDRTTPLTEQEIQVLQEDLDVYSLFPSTAENRLMEVVPFGNQYIFSPVFVPRVETKAVSGGSMLVYATYGGCPFNVCNKIPIKVFYDMDSNGNVVYAFGGTEHSINGAGPVSCSVCPGETTYSSIYYKCEWGNTIYLKLWISFCKVYGWGSSLRGYLYSEGYVDIKTGRYNFETHEISRNELPPEIYTR